MKKIISTLVVSLTLLAPEMIQADILSTVPLAPAATTTPASSPLSCFNFTRTLKSGSTLYDVRALQYAMQKEGFSIPVSEYGRFGDATLAAVNAFQQKYASDILTNGQSPTGMVGLNTRRKLNSLYGCDVVVPVAPMTVPTNVSLQIKNVTIDSNGVTATFCNQSPTAIPVFPARVRLNGIIRDFDITAARGQGACDTVTFPYATWGLTFDPSSTYGVVTALDPNGMYKTSSIVYPLSTTTTLAIPAIDGAHLSVRGVFIKSSGLQGTFCNLGTTDLASYPVRVVLNGVTKDFEVPGAYMHGKCSTVTWTYDNWGVSSTTGTYVSATVNIDPNNIIKETNEYDNSASISGTI